MTDPGRPSLTQILVYDLLASGLIGVFVATFCAIHTKTKDLGLAWYWEGGALLVATGFIAGVGRLLGDRVTSSYERAWADRAFHLEFKPKRLREGFVYWCALLIFSLVIVGSSVIGPIVAIEMNAWTHENRLLFAFATVALLPVSIVISSRLAAFCAVRIEERLATVLW